MSVTVLFTQEEDAVHRNVLLEDHGRGLMVQSNQHLVIHDGEALLLDPGGHKTFQRALTQVSQLVGAGGRLRYLFCSHQDPDVVAALNGWLMATDAEVLVSSLWERFIPHFGLDSRLAGRVRSIPDEGIHLKLGGSPLIVIPAHFLHSCGNFQLYDPLAKILYSGDLGASFGMTYLEVDELESHIPYMAAFHERYMSSQQMLRAWVKMVRPLELEIIAPQHGAFFVGRPLIDAFLDWLEGLSCGTNIMAEKLRIPDY